MEFQSEAAEGHAIERKAEAAHVSMGYTDTSGLLEEPPAPEFSIVPMNPERNRKEKRPQLDRRASLIGRA